MPNPLPGHYVRVWLTPLGKLLFGVGNAASWLGLRRLMFWSLDEMFGARRSWYMRSRILPIPVADADATDDETDDTT